MSEQVKLYVYDLSNGLAKSMSLPLTGKQIDGIWHTSVIVFGQEIFYGQGISRVRPGTSHHGQPLSIHDMGNTAIDKETFEEYLQEMDEHYTAEKYHLLDFNCNTFSQDVVSFLTGANIPAYIKDLPSDFLSTPFGASLRPMIDNMYRPRVPASVGGPAPREATPPMGTGGIQDALLQAVANGAFASQQNDFVTTAAGTSGRSLSGARAEPALNGDVAEVVVSPLHSVTQAGAFDRLKSEHRCVVAMFTSETCAPCRAIMPTYESLARSHSSMVSSGDVTPPSAKTSAGAARRQMKTKQVAFVKVESGPASMELMSREHVSATPTFRFYMDGRQVNELKGADAAELETQVDLLLYSAYPPHHHTKVSVKAIEALPKSPIRYTTAPNISTAVSKLVGFIESSSRSADPNVADAKKIIQTRVKVWLESRFAEKALTTGFDKGEDVDVGPAPGEELLSEWSAATVSVVGLLEPEQVFPAIDLLRLALVDGRVAEWLALKTETSASVSASDPASSLLATVLALVRRLDSPPRPLLLTSLRMICNALAAPSLAAVLLSPASSQASSRAREDLTSLIVSSLLHEDGTVRTAAAGVAFNAALWIWEGRVEWVDGEVDEVEGDWETEVVSALLEAIKREESSEDVVHRLSASLALLLHLSPSFGSHLEPLLDVLEAPVSLEAKAEDVKVVRRDEVKRLLLDVAKLTR